VKVIQTDSRPRKLTYVQSTDQVWVHNHHHHHHHHQQQQQQQQQGDDDDDDDDEGEVVVIRQASEHLLHHVVHIDQQQRVDSDKRLIAVRPLSFFYLYDIASNLLNNKALEKRLTSQ